MTSARTLPREILRCSQQLDRLLVRYAKDPKRVTLVLIRRKREELNRLVERGRD